MVCPPDNETCCDSNDLRHYQEFSICGGHININPLLFEELASAHPLSLESDGETDDTVADENLCLDENASSKPALVQELASWAIMGIL